MAKGGLALEPALFKSRDMHVGLGKDVERNFRHARVD